MEIREDVEYAKALETFFNAVVYDTTQFPEASDKENKFYKDFRVLLNHELIQALQSNADFRELFMNTEKSSITQTGKKGEAGFAELMLKTIQAATNATLSDSASLIKGLDQATVVIGSDKDKSNFIKQLIEHLPIEIAKTISEQIDNRTIQTDGVWRFKYKQGKIDLNSGRDIIGTVDANLNPAYERLLDVRASIKNYKGTTVHLEQADIVKAYQGIVTALRHDPNIKYDNRANILNRLFSDYYVDYKLDDNSTVTQHFNHILGTYALTGMGTINKATIENPASKNTFVNFIFYNNYRKKRIYVFSTKDLVQKMLADNGKSGIAIGRISDNRASVTLSTFKALKGRNNEN